MNSPTATDGRGVEEGTLFPLDDSSCLLAPFPSPPTTMITTATPAGSSTPNNSNNNKRRGAFILLEGVDRCGKTTQVGLLVKHLLSLSIATVAYRFPDRTTQGEDI
jgi:hypothetical protein